MNIQSNRSCRQAKTTSKRPAFSDAVGTGSFYFSPKSEETPTRKTLASFCRGLVLPTGDTTGPESRGLVFSDGNISEPNARRGYRKVGTVGNLPIFRRSHTGILDVFADDRRGPEKQRVPTSI